MKYAKYILSAFAFMALASCSEEELGPTIFPDVSDDADPSSYTYQFDTWVNREFRDVYNLEFKYRMEDVEADMNYNLVPAKYDKARDLCLLSKYLWFDAYKEHAGVDFLKQYGPRILHLIGSPAINATTGTEILGLAEGGLKVTLFKVNEMDVDNINMLNELYFRTMHHEFGHILHQTKSYPVEFNLLSAGRYDDSSWQSQEIGYVNSLGFVTPYSSSQYREDYAETIANYITRPQSQLDLIMWMAAKGWSNGKDEDDKNLDPDAHYYCYYYIPNPEEPEKRTYILYSEEKDSTFRPSLVDENGNHYYTVEEVEAYIAKRSEEVPGGLIPVEDKDGVDGADMILQKQNIVRNWFTDAWKLDYDAMRKIVLRRQQDFDIQALRAEIDAVK